MSHTDHERLVLSVRDDGVGLPKDLEPLTGATLGLRLVSNLARQIRGEVTLPANAGEGAAFDVTFPVPAGTVLEKET